MGVPAGIGQPGTGGAAETDPRVDVDLHRGSTDTTNRGAAELGRRRQRPVDPSRRAPSHGVVPAAVWPGPGGRHRGERGARLTADAAVLPRVRAVRRRTAGCVVADGAAP